MKLKYLFTLLFLLLFSPSASAQQETKTFYWEAPIATVVLSYHLYWWEIGPVGAEQHLEVPRDKTYATVTTLPAGKTYLVNVACIGFNPFGEPVYSGRSNTLCFGPACPASGSPRSPTGVRIVGN